MLNIHPNWRVLGLNAIKMHKRYLRENPYSVDMKRILKQAQIALIKTRQIIQKESK